MSRDSTECLSLLSRIVKSKVGSGTVVSQAPSVGDYGEGDGRIPTQLMKLMLRGQTESGRRHQHICVVCLVITSTQ